MRAQVRGPRSANQVCSSHVLCSAQGEAEIGGSYNSPDSSSVYLAYIRVEEEEKCTHIERDTHCSFQESYSVIQSSEVVFDSK